MKIFVFILLFVFSSDSHACIRAEVPGLEKMDTYSHIYIGQVTGVVMHEWESMRAESITKGENTMWFTDITQQHQVRAVVTKEFKGETEAAVKLEISGCAISIPSPLMYGIFFIESEGGNVIPIYEKQGQMYYDAIIAFAKENH